MSSSIYPALLREMSENSAHRATEFVKSPIKAAQKNLDFFKARNTRAQQDCQYYTYDFI